MDTLTLVTAVGCGLYAWNHVRTLAALGASGLLTAALQAGGPA